MTRPLSEHRRSSILLAATELIAETGLAATTMEIGRRAGISNGSLFTYFANKTELYNTLCYELGLELTGLIISAIGSEVDVVSKMRAGWRVATRWGMLNPQKRRALAHFAVCDQISPEKRAAVYIEAAPAIDLVIEVSKAGALREAPREYVCGLVEGMVTTTVDHMIQHPQTAEEVSRRGFEALWKMLT